MATITALPDFSTIHDDTPLGDEWIIDTILFKGEGSLYYNFIRDASRDYWRKDVIEKYEALLDRYGDLGVKSPCLEYSVANCMEELIRSDYQYALGNYCRGRNRFFLSNDKKSRSLEQFCSTVLMGHLLKLTDPATRTDEERNLLGDPEFLKRFHAFQRAIVEDWFYLSYRLAECGKSLRDIYTPTYEYLLEPSAPSVDPTDTSFFKKLKLF